RLIRGELRRLVDRRLPRPQRQAHPKYRTVVLAAARRGHGAAVQFDDMPHDAKAQAEAAVLTGRAAVALAEALEQVLGHLRLEADAGVRDADRDVARRRLEADVDDAAGRRELDRVSH